MTLFRPFGLSTCRFRTPFCCIISDLPAPGIARVASKSIRACSGNSRAASGSTRDGASRSRTPSGRTRTPQCRIGGRPGRFARLQAGSSRLLGRSVSLPETLGRLPAGPRRAANPADRFPLKPNIQPNRPNGFPPVPHRFPEPPDGYPEHRDGFPPRPIAGPKERDAFPAVPYRFASIENARRIAKIAFPAFGVRSKQLDSYDGTPVPTKPPDKVRETGDGKPEGGGRGYEGTRVRGYESTRVCGLVSGVGLRLDFEPICGTRGLTTAAAPRAQQTGYSRTAPFPASAWERPRRTSAFTASARGSSPPCRDTACGCTRDRDRATVHPSGCPPALR